MKKLSGNGLWESSRMMLFEHRDALIERQSEQTLRARPLLDEQFQYDIAEKLSSAFQHHQAVHIRIYGGKQDKFQTGVISRLDSMTKRIRLNDHWIPLSDILDVQDMDE